MKKIAFTLVVAGSITLSACNKKAEGQVVAVVNGQEITEQQLNAEIRAAHVPESADKKRVTSAILQRMVERTALIQKAKSDGVEKSSEYLDKVQADKDSIALAIYAEQLKRKIKTPDDATINDFIAKNPNMFSQRRVFALDQVIFPILSDKALLGQLAGIHSLDALAVFLQTHNVQFTRQKGTLDSLVVKPEFLNQVLSLPPGEPFIVPDAGRFVANKIIDQKAAPIPSDKVHALAVEIWSREQLGNAVRQAQAAATASAKVSYRLGMAPILTGK